MPDTYGNYVVLVALAGVLALPALFRIISRRNVTNEARSRNRTAWFEKEDRRANYFKPPYYPLRRLDPQWLNSFDPNREYNLLELFEKGCIDIRAAGSGITSLTIHVTNLTDLTIKTIITPGTYFIAQGPHQHMVLYNPYRFVLGKKESKTLSVKAACLDADRPTPSDLDLFNGVARTTDQIIAFLDRSKTMNQMTIQAGIWAIINSYTPKDIQQRVVAAPRSSTPAISLPQIKAAKDVLDELGIPNRL